MTYAVLGLATAARRSPGRSPVRTFDAMVGIDHVSRLFLAAEHPKSFISLDRADRLP